MNRRVAAANFREVRRLEDFDFSFNTSIRKDRIFDLATGKFVREQRDVLLHGPPGAGKSHLAQALGLSAIRAGHTVYYRSIFDTVRDFLHDEAQQGHEQILERYLRPDLLIIDDMGMKQLPKRSGETLFEIVLRRHEVKSTMMVETLLSLMGRAVEKADKDEQRSGATRSEGGRGRLHSTIAELSAVAEL